MSRELAKERDTAYNESTSEQGTFARPCKAVARRDAP
jgi:hypothetical protein